MLSILYLAVPTVLAALSIWRLRGVWRVGAIGCLCVVVPSFVRDMIGVAHGGNLTGIYTLMLMTPVFAFLFVLHVTFLISRRAERIDNVPVKRMVAALSSLLLGGSILYSWNYPLLFSMNIGLDPALYWGIGGLLAVTAAGTSFRSASRMSRETSAEEQHSAESAIS